MSEYLITTRDTPRIERPPSVRVCVCVWINVYREIQAMRPEVYSDTLL